MADTSHLELIPPGESGCGVQLPNSNENPPIHQSLVNCWDALSKSKYWIKSRLVTAAFEIRLPNPKITHRFLPPRRIITTRLSGLLQIERRGDTDDHLRLGINLSQQFTGELSEDQMDILRDTWKCIVRWMTCRTGIGFTKWCFLWSRNLCSLMMYGASEEQIWAWFEGRVLCMSPGESDCRFEKEFSEKMSRIINEHESSEDNEGLLQAVSSEVLAEKPLYNIWSRFLQAIMLAIYSIATSKFETASFSEARRLLVLIGEGHPALQL
ncbi:unnamed protein product [Clonostachys byssicola]|uniref:Uncharacterized protein n=1 Tax=Clonostachys byssicola TaxID=160290 RepID=A0A9N9Y2H1_9HYPO|nr:unnamed protein product [Clonostachys byssicola]